MDATPLTFISIFFYLMTDVRERRKGVAFFNVLWINSIFKMDLSNIHLIFIYRASLVTANRKQRYFRSPWLGVSISPLISWVNPFPSTFINRTASFPRKVSSFRESRMSPWKIKLDEVELRSPPFDSFPFLPFYYKSIFTTLQPLGSGYHEIKVNKLPDWAGSDGAKRATWGSLKGYLLIELTSQLGTGRWIGSY